MPIVLGSLIVSPAVSSQEMESLERLLASHSISRAPRLQAVLKFIIDAYLEGRGQEVNEQVIGQRVFNRPAGYNPSEDNIVRVTVRHLRSRLEEYYRTEGLQEAFVVDIPKGKYILAVSPRTLEAAQPAPSSAVQAFESATVPEVSEPSASVIHTPHNAFPSRRGRMLGYSLAGLVLIAVIATGTWRAAQNLVPARAAESAPSTILQLISGHGNRVTVVVTDANLQAYRAIYKKQIQLQDYIDRSYARASAAPSDPNMAGAWQFATGTTETNIASSIVAAELKQASTPEIADIKHPHDLRMHDFQEENIVLLGGPWINPWGQMFEDKFNFRIVPRDGDPAGSELLNLHPQTGEPAAFAPHTLNGITIDYVRIAVLPNLSGNGRIILIGATNQQSLAAGGDFLADPKSASTLNELFHQNSSSKLPSFEIVIEVKGLDDVPQSRRVVAYRAITDGA